MSLNDRPDEEGTVIGWIWEGLSGRNLVLKPLLPKRPADAK